MAGEPQGQTSIASLLFVKFTFYELRKCIHRVFRILSLGAQNKGVTRCCAELEHTHNALCVGLLVAMQYLNLRLKSSGCLYEHTGGTGMETYFVLNNANRFYHCHIAY